MALMKSALAAIATMCVSAAFAQQTPMPEDIAWKLLEIGRVIDVPKTAALYAPLQQKEPYAGVKVERDVKYGPADRNLLDVFTPEANSSSRPVLIFIHGGGFVAGNKRNPGSPFYDNIMLWAVKSGFVAGNATYRLAPQFMWPAGSEDLASVVQWVSEKIGQRGSLSRADDEIIDAHGRGKIDNRRCGILAHGINRDDANVSLGPELHH